MDTTHDPKHEVDQSSDGKLSDSQLEAPHPYVADLPPDPDAHLSAEERAKIVSFSPKTPSRFLGLGLHLVPYLT